MKIIKSINDEIKDLLNNCFNNNKLDLDQVCDQLKLDYYEADFKNEKISGILLKNKDNKFGIYVNRKHSAARKRFTIAHEIGHFLSWKHKSHSFDKLDKNDGIKDFAISFRHEDIKSLEEIEANQIAAELLMPENKVRELADQGLTIEEMADMFFVSEAAMTIRLKSFFPDLMVV